jgi:hypothetical protein
MAGIKYVYYRDGEVWIGWLEDSPDYRTQGTTEAELVENLRDIHRELTSGSIPAVRRVGELAVI